MNAPSLQERTGLLDSSVAKKLVSGLTGLALVGFVIAHLLGNLSLFVGAEAMNTYAHLLHSAGGGYLVYVFEAILLVFFLGHIVSGIQVWAARNRARPAAMRYAVTGDAGGTSRKSSSSLTMIYTGLLLLAFTVFHLISFKFGPAESEGYIAVHNGIEMRDVYRLVVEKFKNPYYTAGYVVMMALLGCICGMGFGAHSNPWVCRTQRSCPWSLRRVTSWHWPWRQGLSSFPSTSICSQCRDNIPTSIKRAVLRRTTHGRTVPSKEHCRSSAQRRIPYP